MPHTITAKLNKPARKHQGQNGTTFFVSLGEKNYNYTTKSAEWTNYEAALFAKDAQIAFYESVLIENAVIEVNAGGIIIDASNPEYKPKLVLQDAKLGFTHQARKGKRHNNSKYSSKRHNNKIMATNSNNNSHSKINNNQYHHSHNSNSTTQTHHHFN